MGPEWPEPKTLQHWPGKMISELANKVPTAIQYDETSKKVKNWGFLCNTEHENAEILDCFKLYLDPDYRDQTPNPPKLEEARRWYRDYLRCLHDHIDETFSNTYTRWKSLRTEFVFSVPTTWKNPNVIADTIAIIREAGFGSDGPDHRADIGLTEAEAAAVYASKHQFDKDDVILVCDAGGGTTDVNVLKMNSHRGESTQLKQLTWVEGQSIGSALIDVSFHHMISDRLNKIRSHLQSDPQSIADQMLQGKFERMKCSYGTSAASAIPTIPLQVPGMPPGYNFPNINIEDSKMILRREELKGFFDLQVDRMLNLIDEQFRRTEADHPMMQISYLVLSGGLGSSPYVRHRLKSHFETGPGSSKANAQDLKIVTVAEPQLAVVHGLVMDRVQSISRGEVVFEQRCCRTSYGVLCLQEYNPNNPKHTGQDVILDPRDGKKYVEDQIQWFVQQGQSISSKGVMKPFLIKIKPGQEDKPWRNQIIMSSNPRERLPSNLQQDGAKRICAIESVLKDRGVEMKLKNRHWYNSREQYLRLKFDVKVILGAADLRFQLQTKDKKVISTDHEAIQVKWEVPSQASPDERDALTGMYTAE